MQKANNRERKISRDAIWIPAFSSANTMLKIFSLFMNFLFFFFRISLLQSHSVDSLSWASWCWQSSRNSWKIHLSCKYTRLYITEGIEAEVLRHIAIVRDCMKAVDQNVWCTSVTTDTKLRLYSVCVLPVLVYGAETLTLTKALAARVDAWCQRRITVTMGRMHDADVSASLRLKLTYDGLAH